MEYDVAGFEGVMRAFKTYVRQHRSELALGEIDAISDNRDLPDEVEVARRDLIRRGEVREGRKRWWRRRGDPQMAIELDLRDRVDFELFEAFGAYSIEASGYGPGAGKESLMVHVHDSGTILTLFLEHDEVEDFAREANLPAQALLDIESARERARQRLRRRRS